MWENLLMKCSQNRWDEIKESKKEVRKRYRNETNKTTTEKSKGEGNMNKRRK